MADTQRGVPERPKAPSRQSQSSCDQTVRLFRHTHTKHLSIALLKRVGNTVNRYSRAVRTPVDPVRPAAAIQVESGPAECPYRASAHGTAASVASETTNCGLQTASKLAHRRMTRCQRDHHEPSCETPRSRCHHRSSPCTSCKRGCYLRHTRAQSHAQNTRPHAQRACSHAMREGARLIAALGRTLKV